MTAVETKDLSKRYGEHIALDRVNFHVPEGAVYVLVGANGAGKSFDVQDPAQCRATKLRRCNSIRPRHRNRCAAGTGTNRVRPRTAGIAISVDDVRASSSTRGGVLSVVGFDLRRSSREVARHPHAAEERKFSKGELRRIQLAMAMAHRPPLLLLDEPTEGLDPVARRQLLTLLSEHLSDSPATVVIATHHAHEVDSLATTSEH